jgi:AcrR family transcriptional regulator
MPRIVKPAPERKAELVDCAVALFVEKGYEATTIADIINRTRLSKGAFYHHFSSKEELLDAFTERLASSMFADAQAVLEDASIDELTRFTRFLERTGRFQFDAEPAPIRILESLLKPENAVLYQRIQAVFAKAATPVLTAIINRGVSSGEFNVVDTPLVVDLIVHLASSRHAATIETYELARSGKLKAAAELLDHRLHAEQLLLDRLLGLPPGAIQVFPPGYTKLIVASVAKTARRRAL